MSGYRQSGFDPNAYERPGPPMRPFNWVQWTGVAFSIAYLAIQLAYLAGRHGWIPVLFDSPVPAIGLLVGAIVLVNSRQQPVADPAPELAPARRRWLIIIVAICTVIFGAAAVIQFSGAN